MSVDRELQRIQEQLEASFQDGDRIRSFDQFVEGFAKNPRCYLRTSPQYLVDVFDWLATREAERVGQEAIRYCIFDGDGTSDGAQLTGQERVQEEIYNNLQAAAKRGKAEKMLLLHGPNGSGKTTVVECLIRGLERYSATDDGEVLRFNWIFSDRDDRRDRIGFESEREDDEVPLDTYAYLEEKDTNAKIPCELRDSPIFLIPKSERRALIDSALSNCDPMLKPRFPYDYFLDGDLCQKCKRIYDALLLAYQGDWRKVMRHVQIERYFISRRYRRGAASIEPQGNVDGTTRFIQHESSWNIPAILRNVSLYEPVGDIVDANRGILEYSDFLKRPPETNKYLLTTCERGTVNLSNCIAFLDVFICGTSNEKQLNLFKRSPDFSSFKGRMELVAVPYLLRYSLEERLYTRQIELYSRDRHVSPHTAKVAALWAVLTRLRKPIPERYEGVLKTAVNGLSPLEKARLYDSGEAPTRLTEEQRKTLRAGVIDVRLEYEDVEGEFEGIHGPEYEGRHGASPREMMTVLARAAESKTYHCLTPMSVLDALGELLKDTSLYEFLRLASDGEYYNVHKFVEIARDEYLRWITDEVYTSISLVEEEEYDRVFLEFFRHVKAFHTGEKVFNPSTDSYDGPNEDLMASIEGLLNLKEPKEKFRSEVITRIAAWALDHPKEKIDYQNVFNDIYTAMRENFYRQRNRLLTLIEQDILKYGTDEFELLSESEKEQVEKALENMTRRYGYCEHCARDAIAFVLRYHRHEEPSEKEVAESAKDASKVGTKS